MSGPSLYNSYTKSLFRLVLFTVSTGLSLSCTAASVEIDSLTPDQSRNATLTLDIEFPDGDGPFPAVLLMHGCGGLSPVVKRGLSEHGTFLRQNGYATAILDSFGPRGIDKMCKPAETQKARRFRTYDAFHSLAALKKNPRLESENIFLVGQSNGGSVAIRAAGGGARYDFSEQNNFTAVAAYYPWCGLAFPPLKTPLLVLGAGKDQWVSPKRCVDKQDVLSEQLYKVVLYPDAYHSFDLPMKVTKFQGHTVGGDPEATTDSRQQILQFFNQHRK